MILELTFSPFLINDNHFGSSPKIDAQEILSGSPTKDAYSLIELELTF